MAQEWQIPYPQYTFPGAIDDSQNSIHHDFVDPIDNSLHEQDGTIIVQDPVNISGAQTLEAGWFYQGNYDFSASEATIFGVGSALPSRQDSIDSFGSETTTITTTSDIWAPPLKSSEYSSSSQPGSPTPSVSVPNAERPRTHREYLLPRS